MVKDFAARSEIRQVLRSVIKHIVPVITDYDELTFERMLFSLSVVSGLEYNCSVAHFYLISGWCLFLEDNFRIDNKNRP